jgi:HD-like signal output (HDOD) protein
MDYIGWVGVGLLGVAGWILYRRRAVPSSAGGTERARMPAPAQATSEDPAANSRSPQSLDLARLCSVNQQAAERLWKLAYAAPATTAPLDKSHAEVRVAVVARLQPETLNPDYFPRRPTLMQQLMRAVDDPNAEADKLARMISHDPVIAADVLRIANSTLYRNCPEPIESVQRAIVVCGVDSLRGILATAMVRPVFRATRSNFPRLPRLLWERTERATRTAELYALSASPQDRFEAQLAVLLSALGPLVVYSAALDAYAKRPRLTPNPSLLVELTMTLSAEMSRRIAQEWGASPRLICALEKLPGEFLSGALTLAELAGTLSVLEAHTVFSNEDRQAMADAAGLDATLIESLTATPAVA